ncbi:hypothetical protein OOK43_29895 [[Kitasatospora] papulosa]|uniref:hypothetical protein n=1 Tax=[Kitasatospora] papulosa TaxID=1464011 RepID=UPI0022556943|nr:hypothetical protein [[Kitasatospora] papulosa]MCX4417451.1 hypothetical protein [[Kitasatospora] papulosa]
MTSTFTTTDASRGIRHRRPRRSVAPVLVPAVIWAGVAGVLALWWSDTSSVVGPAGWITGAGRITGLLAGYGCAILLLLMARLPLLDHTVGTDRLFETLPGQVTLVYRARHAEDLALRGELDAIAARRQATVHYVTGGTAGYSSSLTARGLSDMVPDLAAHDVYLCGPPGMARTATEALRRAGVPARRIHHESFEF